MVRAGTCGCVEGAFAAFGTPTHLPIITGSPKRFEEGRGEDPGPSDYLGEGPGAGALGFGRGSD